MAPGAEARYWRAAEGGRVVCELCPHDCTLGPGETGLCGVRRHDGGRLVTDVGGWVATAQAAPIERKFLYHVAPGTLAYSYGAPGCNLRCRFCQNWMVSQAPKGRPSALGHATSAPELVQAARDAGCRAVAGTFTEPSVSFELALSVAQEAHAAGLLNVWKTNGFIGAAPQAEIAPLLDAVNVDLKAWRDSTYQELMGCRLRPVCDALERFRAAGVWVEVTTLVIPTLNDSREELDGIARYLLAELGPDTPWHLNRFHPDHALRHLPPTPRATLHAARQRALDLGLRYVYTDVEPRGTGWDTVCPACGTLLIERAQYALVADHRLAGRCPDCGLVVPGA